VNEGRSKKGMKVKVGKQSKGLKYLVVSSILTTLVDTERGKTSIDFDPDLLRSTDEVIIMVDLITGGDQAEAGYLITGSNIRASYFISKSDIRSKEREI